MTQIKRRIDQQISNEHISILNTCFTPRLYIQNEAMTIFSYSISRDINPDFKLTLGTDKLKTTHYQRYTKVK